MYRFWQSGFKVGPGRKTEGGHFPKKPSKLKELSDKPIWVRFFWLHLDQKWWEVEFSSKKPSKLKEFPQNRRGSESSVDAFVITYDYKSILTTFKRYSIRKSEGSDYANWVFLNDVRKYSQNCRTNASALCALIKMKNARPSKTQDSPLETSIIPIDVINHCYLYFVLSVTTRHWTTKKCRKVELWSSAMFSYQIAI